MDSEKITVKYFAQNEFCKEPYQASEDVAGYDLFAAETLTLFPEMNGCISLAFRFAMPKGFYGKIFPRSGLFKEYLITCDAGVLDPDFRGIVQVLMMNHHPEKISTIRTGDRAAQCVFMKKYNVEFEEVSDMGLLGNTKRGADGFGSTGGVGAVTKVIKLDESDSENNGSHSDNEMLILPAKKKVIAQADWLQITAERVRMQIDDGKIIIDEK